jgi:hypothetical protein
VLFSGGAPGGIRTPDPRIRSADRPVRPVSSGAVVAAQVPGPVRRFRPGPGGAGQRNDHENDHRARVPCPVQWARRAIRCAVAIPQELRAEGVEVRIGLLAGEVELGGDDLGRIAVSPCPPTRDVPPRPPVGSDARNGSANHAFGRCWSPAIRGRRPWMRWAPRQPVRAPTSSSSAGCWRPSNPRQHDYRDHDVQPRPWP